MHAVVETPTYLTDAKSAGVTDEERAAVVLAIASDPAAGDVIPGTGGIRKIRIAGKGKGKSGGCRIISYYTADDVPVLLLALVSKGQRADISQAERNVLRTVVATLAETYRQGVANTIREGASSSRE